jgi:hypothetical protein
MKAILKYDEDDCKWCIEIDNKDGTVRCLPIHYEQELDIDDYFNREKQYDVEFSLSFIVEKHIYCAKIAKSSFPEKAVTVILDQVTRFEVIDETGRAYVKYDNSFELSYQDDGKTLKVFVYRKK